MLRISANGGRRMCRNCKLFEKEYLHRPIHPEPAGRPAAPPRPSGALLRGMIPRLKASSGEAARTLPASATGHDMYIGILEDDAAQQELYKLWFGSPPHSCQCHGSARSFIEALQKERFDLLLLDWMLPESSGEAVLKWVRENLGWELPVIFITSRDSEVDVVTALRAGADDYVVKPPKFHELLARIESLSRRTKAPPLLKFGAYEVDQERRSIAIDGKPVELTQKEFELACYMFQSPGKLLSRVHLLEKLWGLNANVDTRTVDTHVSRIRRKLGIGPERGWQIIPVYGWGYRIEKVGAGETAAKPETPGKSSP
jgi:DNA-binding response OmpR family regulator